MFRMISFAVPLTSFTGTFSFHVRLVSYFTCDSTRSAASAIGRRNGHRHQRPSPLGDRARDLLELLVPFPSHVRGRVVEDRQGQQSLGRLILAELASAPK